ncbi:MAG: S8 family serine peptidase [Phycisphaerales bacterium]|nr:S8 family serine peptidase [Phycisphaerales bacterium]
MRTRLSSACRAGPCLAGCLMGLLTTVASRAQSPESQSLSPSPDIQRHMDNLLQVIDGASAGGPVKPVAPRPDRLLVRFQPGSASSSRRAIHRLNPAARVVHDVRSVDGLCIVELSPDRRDAVLAAYRAQPQVLYAEQDAPIHIADVPDDEYFNRLWGMQNTGQPGFGFFCYPTGTPGADIRAAQAWDVWTGDPDFRVAVIDTGVNYLHPDLAGNMWTNPGEIPGNGIDDDANGWIDDVHGYDFHNGDSDPMDDHRHGSHVSGTIGAVGNNGIGVAGVNHQCKIVALKVFNQNGSGSTSSAVMAMDYVIQAGIRVSNNSWGCSSENPLCFSLALHDVIEASQTVGHVFIAAAGNDFKNDNDKVPYYPVGYALDNIVGVAAIDNRDNLAIFSNRGATSVDLGAPGTCVYSTVLGDGYGYLDGTSMAAPHVTGVFALVMSRLPEMPWPQVKERVLRTARGVASLDGQTLTGAVVNAAAAVWDCNSNGVVDETDIASGASDDCNGNRLPDECEPDCNDNDVADDCDIAGGGSSDCAGNGVPDECEPDCNENGVPDGCDIGAGFSEDCDGRLNGNGIPDECEPDCNKNGVADSCDLEHGSPDCDHDAVPDECEPGGAPSDDCNANARPDLCDIFFAVSRDCNQNARPDECDIAVHSSADCTNNTIPDECEPDCNENGRADSCDIAAGSSIDCSGNRVPDECEPDCNQNDVADVCDIAGPTSDDCNNNRIPDECEPHGKPEDDCNGNGLPDLCDIFNRTNRDCNSNFALDDCDISDGGSQDANGNATPDECDGKGFLLVPVGATGSHDINGNEITLHEGGQTVQFEVRISGWDLNLDGQPRLRGYQPEVNGSNFHAGLYGGLDLLRAPCQHDDDCPGLNVRCEADGFCNAAGAVYVDTAHPNYVFANLFSLWVANVITTFPDFRIINALFNAADSLVDPGVEKYAATVFLQATDLIGGTFEIGFESARSAFAGQNSQSITIPTLTPAIVVVPSDCNGNGVLDEIDIAGGVDDCNENGVPDECLHIETDCNANAIPDDCDIADNNSQDCTSNGIPDECEPDCNGNGAADSCDISAAGSVDINVNGVPDECDPLESIFVDQINCFFPGSGTMADPFCDIGLAVQNAGSGAESLIEIIIRDGVYSGPLNAALDVDGRRLTIRSQNGPQHCIVDGGGTAAAWNINSGETALYIDGLTFRNGYGNTGGSVFIRDSRAVFRRCVFEDNLALRYGGVAYSFRGQLVFENCSFVNNRADVFYGGAVYAFQGATTIRNCLFAGNQAELGGAFFITNGALTVQQCTFFDNQANARGGAVYVSTAGLNVDGSVFRLNDADAGSQLYLAGSGAKAIRYSDVTNGQAGVLVASGPLSWGPGNFDLDPDFVDPAGGDFRLAPSSPCINGGDPAFVPRMNETDLTGAERVLFDIVDSGALEAGAFTDCDANAAPDGRDLFTGAAMDCNDNDVLDGCELAGGQAVDVLPPDGDGIPDDCQSDCDGNQVPDDQDLAGGNAADCNINGVLDRCDIDNGTSLDCDANGAPDECEVFGDYNEDDLVDIFDILCVLSVMIGRTVDCDADRMDIGQCRSDGIVDIFDLFAVLDAFQGINVCCP